MLTSDAKTKDSRARCVYVCVSVVLCVREWVGCVVVCVCQVASAVPVPYDFKDGPWRRFLKKKSYLKVRCNSVTKLNYFFNTEFKGMNFCFQMFVSF